MIKEFSKITGCSVIINTSFNIRGEPIVCTPEDAYRCFMCTNMDYLVIENFIFEKTKQPDQDKYKKDDISQILD
jgi:carbamoyltransferase